MSLRSCVPMVFVVPVVFLMATGCPQSGSPRSSARGTRIGASPTAPPRGGAPETLDTTYDPGGDPLNRDGWAWSRPRSAEDPEDAGKSPFSIEALYRLRDVADPRWSPDGARILFVVTASRAEARQEQQPTSIASTPTAAICGA